MDMLTALLQLLIALFGVDLGGSTFSHRSTVDGVDTLYSLATVESGIARFECLASASGRCYYTVFPAPCAGRCEPTPPRRFAVPAGSLREIAGLSVEALCVRGDEAAVAAACERPPALASR